MQTNVIKIGGMNIKLSDIRGQMGNQILLVNGMKIDATSEERAFLQKKLNARANEILKQDRPTGARLELQKGRV